MTFLNEQTGEYQFYEIQFRAARPGVLATIQLSTLVRQRKQHTVSLENPLTSAVTFSASCTVPDIQMPSQLVVPPMSEVNSENMSNLVRYIICCLLDCAAFAQFEFSLKVFQL